MWHIWYRDSRFCSTDGDPEDAPLDGVQVIIDEPPNNRAIVQGMDYYLSLGDSWAGGNRADLERWIRAGLVKPGAVKFGLWIPDHEYRRIVDMALRGCDGH